MCVSICVYWVSFVCFSSVVSFSVCLFVCISLYCIITIIYSDLYLNKSHKRRRFELGRIWGPLDILDDGNQARMYCMKKKTLFSFYFSLFATGFIYGVLVLLEVTQ